MINFNHFNSLIKVINFFSTEKACEEAIIEARWHGDVVCPHCGKHHCTRRADGRFRCNGCKHNFSFKTNTIFENTKLPLQTWFIVMYYVSSHKKGVPSCQIMRDSDVTQKTAWFMLHKIRGLYGITDETSLNGTVEMDECYKHQFVNHSQREYVRAKDIHTNGIEGYWAHFKRVIFSTYHLVSKDYLQRYFDEQTYRWNTRKWKSSKRFEDMFNRVCKSFDYADILALSSVVSRADFYSKRAIYYAEWEKQHCA